MSNRVSHFLRSRKSWDIHPWIVWLSWEITRNVQYWLVVNQHANRYPWYYSIWRRCYGRYWNIFEKSGRIGGPILKKASKPWKKIGRRKSARKTKGKNPKRKWYKNKFQIEKFIKVKKEPNQRKKKAQQGLVLSEKTTLNSLISNLNFAKVPLT